MKLGGWASLLVIVAGLDACRGSYIGAEDCGGSGDGQSAGKASCPVCEVCEKCNVCDEDVDAGALVGKGGASGKGGATSSGKGGAAGHSSGDGGGNGGVWAESGAAGNGSVGSPDLSEACALKDELPNPAFYVSFDDCDETTSSIEAKLGRAPYGTDLTTWIGEKRDVFENSDLPCVAGKFGLGMQFGAGRVVFAGNPNIEFEHDATLSVWVRQDAAQATPSAGSAIGRWWMNDQFGLAVTGTTWTFTAAIGADQAFYVSGEIELGAWTQLVIVARRGAELKFYRDGVRVAQASPVTLPPDFAFQSTLADLSLGRLADLAWEPYFGGALDELRIFKTALSDLEVAALHCE